MIQSIINDTIKIKEKSYSISTDIPLLYKKWKNEKKQQEKMNDKKKKSKAVRK